MKNLIENKNILVIGGTGSIGQRLVAEILEFNPKVVRVYSRDEYKQFELEQEWNSYKDKIRFLIGDIRDKERLSRAMRKINIVFSLAALKHVPACEYNPFEAVMTNVIGTQNVIDAAIENGVERVIYTSTDKAINPTNTMGATKLLAERLISSADYTKGGNRPIFAAVRFGNVMGSRGSVIPLFEEQILANRKITLTHPDMTRFMMSISQAAKLVLKAAYHAQGGEIFVLKMPVLRLRDLAQAVIELVCTKHKINQEDVIIDDIGLRPGEKMYEELMTAEECQKAIELEGMYKIPRLGNEVNQSVDTYSIDSSKNDRYLCVNEIKEIINEVEVI